MEDERIENKKIYYIPIIGTISAGKSTFLKGLLGTNVLQTGETITTKFVCLIKNSNETKFYHVKPIKKNTLYFEKKKEEEIKGEENIKKKIEDINKKKADNENKNDEIFYMLETPIKNIDNKELLDNCIFMDIPGLNEAKSNYIDIIFSLISDQDIIFEIMIFDATSNDSDNKLNILKELEKKKCLKKTNNIFVLNKIDKFSLDGEDNIIDQFKQKFYEAFGKEKGEAKIYIDIYKNHFIPMNSLLYMSETRINEDFKSLLLFELFNYANNPKKADSFFEFIKKKGQLIIKNLNLQINDKLGLIKDNEIKMIKNSVEYIQKINQKNGNKILLNLNIKKNTMEELKIIYYIHKNQNYIFFHSEYYNKLQEIINNIKINISNKNEKKENKENNNNNIEEGKQLNKNNISLIEDIDKFLNVIFKEIDPEKELSEFRISLQSIRENILIKKIRIAFIGNINVGKSTILNSIIGHNILPTKGTECTNRGVIICNENIDTFRLFRAKLITRGNTFDNLYSYFETEKDFQCEGINEINSYLKNKNNDQQINDDDAFVIIKGKLKIFEFNKSDEFDDNLINSIEFIDLPGHDRENNIFNQNAYYDKILQFINCCIYVNEPLSINDENSVKKMIEQYKNDKQKVFLSLRPNFINTCLFLVNKCDILSENYKRDTEQIKEDLFKHIKDQNNNLIIKYKESNIKIEDKENNLIAEGGEKDLIIENKNNNIIIEDEEKNLKIEDMNVSFFSGESINYYWDALKFYVETLDKNPMKVFNKLISDYYNSSSEKDFKEYIISTVFDAIDEQLGLELNENDENIEIPNNFKHKLKEYFHKLYDMKYILPIDDMIMMKMK